MLKKLALLSLIVAFLGVPSVAGVVYRYESRDLTSPDLPVDLIEVSSQGRYIRMDIELNEEGEPANTMIFDAERGVMIVLMHDDREFMEFDRETMEEMGKQVSGAMTQMQKQMESAMANMPPEQRKMMEKMMKDRMPQLQEAPVAAKRELVRTSKKQKVGEYTCVRYDVLRDGEKVAENCVSSWDDVGVPAETRELMKDMASFFEETFGQLAKSMPGGAPAFDSPFDDLEEMNGFPVLTREFENGEPEIEVTLSDVDRRDLDPERFRAPSNYRKREMNLPKM